MGGATLYSNTTSSENTAIGTWALYYNNPTGFGQNTAVGKESAYSNVTGWGNTSSGYQSLYSNTTGVENTAIGWEALYGSTTGSANSVFGAEAGTNNTAFFGTTALGYQATTTASNQVRIGGAGVTSIGGYANWTDLSDGRFKKNVEENISGLDFIKRLRPVSYNLDVRSINNFLGHSKKDNQSLGERAILEKEKIIYSGFIAQEVEEAAKKVGYDFSGVDAPKNEKDLYGLRYAEFVVPLVKAVQELNNNNEELRMQNSELKNEVKELLNRVALLEKNNPAR